MAIILSKNVSYTNPVMWRPIVVDVDVEGTGRASLPWRKQFLILTVPVLTNRIAALVKAPKWQFWIYRRLWRVSMFPANMPPTVLTPEVPTMARLSTLLLSKWGI
eukprot:TRINITY_DN29001_c0_g1_i1.p1 TRINITY_DN29001_c0_g1~~TRINITY_DN29001_c0_g1_i1.p1  ORF type:complete len:105 (-),score=2.10 TRINITY_DN29001_c0_g1_i1:201-515(-)